MTFLPEVVAAVCISGCSSITTSTLHYGKRTLPGLCFDMSKIRISKDGVFDIYETLDDPKDPANSHCRIPIEKAEGHFLFVVGEDDRNWKSSLYAEIAIECLHQHGKDNFTLLSYPGAGHQINPAFSPVCLIALDRVLGVPVLGGGDSRAHAYAQEHSWEKILEFLHFHLRWDFPNALILIGKKDPKEQNESQGLTWKEGLEELKYVTCALSGWLAVWVDEEIRSDCLHYDTCLQKSNLEYLGEELQWWISTNTV